MVAHIEENTYSFHDKLIRIKMVEAKKEFIEDIRKNPNIKANKNAIHNINRYPTAWNLRILPVPIPIALNNPIVFSVL